MTIKRHISISFTAGDISVVIPSPSNHPLPPGTSFLLAGRWRSPSVVEGLRLLTGWRSFRSSWRLSSHPSQVLRHSSWTSMLLSLSTSSTTSPGGSRISPDFRRYLQERLLWRPGVHLVTFLDLWLDGHWLPRRLLISLVLAHFARSNPQEAAVPSVYVVVSTLYTCITAIFTQGLGPDHLFKTRALTPTQVTTSKILASTSAYYFSFVFSWPHKARVLGARGVKSSVFLKFQLILFYVLCWYPFI